MMRKKRIKDVESALQVIIEAGLVTDLSYEMVEHKKANKAFDQKRKAMEFLREVKALPRLEELVHHESVSVRISAATYLLPINESLALKVLGDITKLEGIQSFNAGMTIAEWKKGNLREYLFAE